ncbi:hypothetical protein PVAG01_08918 [Phlyctema vagabunda]|uniref:Uncharacterized protein n=1 Tax=Phlyctema vagabunda TaxID=108571 RepID=A0ABR4PAV3_9HELO
MAIFPEIRDSPVAIGLLRISPALITLTLVINRVAQYYAFTSFLAPHISPSQHDAAPTLQLWFRRLAARIWGPVIALSLLQTILCIVNVFVYPVPAEYGVAWWLHIWSLVLANGHWPFVRTLLRYEHAVKDYRATPKQSLTALEGWMATNNVRVLLVDVPQAFVSAAAALASATWV